MSTFTTSTQVSLSADWVEDLIVTAFDAQYGGSWYWVNEDDDIVTVHVTDGHVDFQLSGPDLYAWSFRLQGPAHPLTARLDAAALGDAWAVIVDQAPIRSDLVEQFTESMRFGDLDVDADAADCLVQIALFGKVVYG